MDGLRVDHVDGLRDPTAYLARLRERAGPGAWIVVEKILERGETLPPVWPIEGTTGYELLAALLDLPIPEAGDAALKEAYAALTDARPPEAARAGIKRSIVRHNFEGELGRVAGLLAPHVERPASREAIRAALAELIVAIPVYRTYGDAEGFDAADLALLAGAAAEAAGEVDGRLIAATVAALARPAAREARARFQQLTGPAMAKAVEDTLFYRQDAVMARNEVGGDPLSPPLTAAEVHAFLAARLEEQPEGISATATHDTKRGEDARARLAALAEAPEAWVAAFTRWREMCEPFREGEVPEPRVEWTIHQALAGCWPSDRAPEGEALENLRERFEAYIVKALRESGRRTEWNDVDETYEGGVLAYVRNLLGPEGAAFRTDFDAAIRPVIEAGHAAGLGWAAIKCLAPGVPDIYQGTEWEDLSLVDPDNRRAPDWETLAALPEMGAEGEKSRLLRACLALRERLPDLFARGAYEPLEATGTRAEEVFAFARGDGAARVVVAVPTRPLAMVASGAGYWEGTALDPGAARRDALGDASHGEGAIPLAELFSARPVAVLRSEG